MNQFSTKSSLTFHDKILKGNNWLSRKLWITILTFVGCIWLLSSNLSQIIHLLTWVIIVYIVSQTVQDIVQLFCTSWVQRNKDIQQRKLEIAKLKYDNKRISPVENYSDNFL